MGNFIEIAFGALGGGVTMKLIDYIFSLKKSQAEVRKIQLENDGSVIGHWQILYNELKTVQLAQNLRINQLEIENAKLREDCISLQQQFNFK